MDIYTIGYEGLGQEQFLSLLKNHNISIVADVRKLPISRKKGFSKRSLSEAISMKGIEYISFQELGTPKDLRNELKETGDYHQFFKRYKDELSNHPDKINEILSMVNDGEKVALLCFEQKPDICHRKIIAAEIKKKDKNGLKVKHLRAL